MSKCLCDSAFDAGVEGIAAEKDEEVGLAGIARLVTVLVYHRHEPSGPSYGISFTASQCHGMTRVTGPWLDVVDIVEV
jgi:hypothetical protein